jgi:hypothetical protein
VDNRVFRRALAKTSDAWVAAHPELPYTPRTRHIPSIRPTVNEVR